MSCATVRFLSSAVSQAARSTRNFGASGSLLATLKSGQASVCHASGLRSLCHATQPSARNGNCAKADGHLWKNTHVCQLHTAGDKDLAAFLVEEIKAETNQKKLSDKLPKIKGFEVTKVEGPEVVLTRKHDNEIVTVKFNINNSVEDVVTEEGDVSGDESSPTQMVSKPAFVVEINKGGDKTLAIHCVFPQTEDDMVSEQHDEDPYAEEIEIQDVTLLNVGQEWTGDVYSLQGSVMDGSLYDMMLGLLEERGINGDFAEQLLEFSTAYEHKKYVGLLEQLKEFVASN